jgi:hypothetical protein
MTDQWRRAKLRFTASIETFERENGALRRDLFRPCALFVKYKPVALVGQGAVIPQVHHWMRR